MMTATRSIVPDRETSEEDAREECVLQLCGEVRFEEQTLRNNVDDDVVRTYVRVEPRIKMSLREKKKNYAGVKRPIVEL